MIRQRAALRRGKAAKLRVLGLDFEEARMNPDVLSSARTIKHLTITIRRAVRHDKVVYLTEQISEAREANDRGDSRLTYKILRNLRRSQKSARCV